MASVRKVYWDSGLFISFLSGSHQREKHRAEVVRDILNHAKDDKIEIWTSVWTIAEVIRPKSPTPEGVPVPDWAELLNAKDADGVPRFPKAGAHFKHIWDHFNRTTAESRPLAEEDAKKIRQMFEWNWIRKIDVVPQIAHHAADIMRNYNMRAGDAIHVASALHRHCDALQCWDKDFSKTDKLILSETPTLLTKPTPPVEYTPDLFGGLGPSVG